eukprot:5866352-Amphidinium_carterae.2
MDESTGDKNNSAYAGAIVARTHSIWLDITSSVCVCLFACRHLFVCCAFKSAVMLMGPFKELP